MAFLPEFLMLCKHFFLHQKNIYFSKQIYKTVFSTLGYLPNNFGSQAQENTIEQVIFVIRNPLKMLDKKSGSESLKTGFDMDILKVKILLFFFENTLKFICYVNFRLQPKVIVFCIRGHSHMTSAYFWTFLTPLPPLSAFVRH